MDINIPEVVEEVRTRFEAYEQALIDKNVDVLDATFWNSPLTIRYAVHENGYGFDEIHAHRVRRPERARMPRAPLCSTAGAGLARIVTLLASAATQRRRGKCCASKCT